jgi:hypothetical protein
VLDRSGNGNTGTIAGASRTTSGKYGRALSFNGSSNWVTVADSNSLDLTSGMTLEAWVYPQSNSGVRDVIMKEGSAIDIYNLYHRNWRGRPEGNVFANGVNRVVEGTSSISQNIWTHLATTYDGTNLRLYVNGVQRAVQALTGTIATSSGVLRIGGNSVWGEYFRGRIDDVRIYNRALAQSEIQSDMNTPVTASRGAVDGISFGGAMTIVLPPPQQGLASAATRTATRPPRLIEQLNQVWSGRADKDNSG